MASTGLVSLAFLTSMPPPPERLVQRKGEVPQWRVYCEVCLKPRIVSYWPGEVIEALFCGACCPNGARFRKKVDF